MPQGGQNPDGWFARGALGSDVNPLLAHLHHNSYAIAGNGTQALLEGEEALGAFLIADQSNQEVGLFLFGGTDGGVTTVAESTSGHFTGTAPTLDVAHDATNDQYEVTNTTASELSVETATLRES